MTVSEYAIRGDDLYALNDLDIQNLFEDQEFEKLLQNVRIQLLPRLDDVRLEEQRNRESSEPPDECMEQFFESLKILKKHFGDDAHAAKIIERETCLANEWIAENEPEEPDRKHRTLGQVETPDKSQSTRSIFDDIDA